MHTLLMTATPGGGTRDTGRTLVKQEPKVPELSSSQLTGNIVQRLLECLIPDLVRIRSM